MTTQTIPIIAVAAQSFTIQLGAQNCAISLVQKNTGLFFSMTVNGASCVDSVLCLNLVGLIREAYYGFSGQLAFFDTQGTSDPYYTGLGDRYVLLYQS
jgi:hypothetical protein